jgi:hypothetical protein
MFRNRLVVLRENLERLEKLRTPPEAPATGLVRLPIEIRLEIYYYCIPRKRVIEVSHPRLNTQWLSADRTLDFEDVQDETDLGDDPDLEDDVTHVLDLEDDVV